MCRRGSDPTPKRRVPTSPSASIEISAQAAHSRHLSVGGLTAEAAWPRVGRASAVVERALQRCVLHRSVTGSEASLLPPRSLRPPEWSMTGSRRRISSAVESFPSAGFRTAVRRCWSSRSLTVERSVASRPVASDSTPYPSWASISPPEPPPGLRLTPRVSACSLDALASNGNGQCAVGSGTLARGCTIDSPLAG